MEAIVLAPNSPMQMYALDVQGANLEFTFVWLRAS